MKRGLLFVVGLFVCAGLSAQPKQVILHQEEGRITFAVDEVDPPTSHCGIRMSGSEIAADLRMDIGGDPFSYREPQILANSFADEPNLYDIGEDVVFKMLFNA